MEPLQWNEFIEYAVFTDIYKTSEFSLNLQDRLNNIVKIITKRMTLDVCSIYLIDENGENCMLRAASGLTMQQRSKPGIPIDKGICGYVYKLKKTVSVRDISADLRFVPLEHTNENLFSSLLAAPILDREGECLGVIVLQTRDEYIFSDNEERLLSTIGRQIGGVIRNAQLYERSERNLKELRIFFEIGRTLNSTLDLDSILEILAEKAAELTDSAGCILRLYNHAKGSLTIHSTFGLSGVSENDVQILLKECPMNKEDLSGIVSEINSADKELFSRCKDCETVFCSPVNSKKGTIGIITVFAKKPREGESAARYDHNDKRVLHNLSNQAAIAIENARLYKRTDILLKEKEDRVKRLSILYDTGNALRLTPDVNRRLQVILTAVTTGNGLGFNRSILMFLDPGGTCLRGEIGIGPNSAEEAGRVWQALADLNGPLSNWLAHIANDGLQLNNPLNAKVKNLRTSLEEDNVLTRTIKERKPYLITDAQVNDLVPECLRTALGIDSFATVPLMAEHDPIGLIIVDNKFNKRPITEQDMQFLTMFAIQAGLSIESGRLYKRLKETNRELQKVHYELNQQEKMAALGKMSASVAHEIRNPLVSIGGFAKILTEELEQGSHLHKFAGIIFDRTQHLEQLLCDILEYSRMPKIAQEKGNLNTIITDALEMESESIRQHDIQIDMELDPNVPDSFLFIAQMKQVFSNLFINARDAMLDKPKRVLAIRTTYLPDTVSKIKISISDTGGGLTDDVMENMFNPFFTTKEKGTGLGLPLTQKIINSHGGAIKAVNQKGEGLKFMICLPCVLEPQDAAPVLESIADISLAEP